MCLPPPSALCCPSSGTRLISNVQTAAAIFALLNDYLVSKNKPSLGWLNPWLYGSSWLKGGFNDIIGGNNPGCNTAGFSATEGWDPVRPANLSPRFRFR
jgi:hypothetical protein